MRNIYLVQRGQFKKEDERKDTGLSGIIDLAYMGYAEFEFGALPKSYARIMQLKENGSLKIIETDIKNVNGVPLQVVCSAGNADNIIEGLRGLIKRYNPEKVVTHPLKSGISYYESCYESHRQWRIQERKKDHEYYLKYKKEYLGREEYNHNEHRDNFWWDIENDFFFFFGVTDRRELVKAAIDHDFETWDWRQKIGKKNNDTVIVI